MSFIELAKERYSVRKYKDQQIEQEKLDLILEAGNVAPTAVNYQPQKIYVLQSNEALTKAKSVSRKVLFSTSCRISLHTRHFTG